MRKAGSMGDVILGKVFQYDPVTGVFRDYGAMVAGEQYARSMEAWNGKLYVGVGTQTPHIVVLDTETGERSEIRLPDECKGEQLVYDLNIVQGKLLLESHLLHGCIFMIWNCRNGATLWIM